MVLKSWSEIGKKLKDVLGNFSAEFTKDILDATVITRRALQEGYDTIVALGGDGTLNEVVNGFFENDRLINPQACLGVLIGGTGSDFAKTLELPDCFEEAADILLRAEPKKCDVGLIRCLSGDGLPVQRYFINIADAGFGGLLVQRVNNSAKTLGPFFTYLIGVLRTLTIYKNIPIQIKVDESFNQELVVNSVVIANAQYFGGGMWIAPQAKIDDGLFDIVIIGDINRREALASIYKIYNGTLATHPKVTCMRGKKVVLSSAYEVLIDADGEQPGKLPATFEILPGVLNYLC
ncbi:MAG: diacylglycerol kinase family lipid kinase [Calditrichaeota bacterium]|nr:MAG: diacylglycerol kinase family lipid kinase [Calditrichota bacterium]